MTRFQSGRRFATVVGVIVSLVLGLGAIRAAAAWTAAAAPLTLTPDSIASLRSELADEQRRSADLLQQLETLQSQSTDLAAALEAARTRIGVDTGHARELSAQLKTAKRRLVQLQAAIAAANRSSQARTITTVRTAATPAPTNRGEPGDDGGGGGDD